MESARAVCFLLDEQGKMVGNPLNGSSAAQKNRPALSSKAGTSFNFVITNPQPFATANLAAKVSFSRMVLDGSKLADMRQSVNVTTAAK